MSHLNDRRRSWKEIAMDVSAENDHERLQELVEELQAALAAGEPGRQIQPPSNIPILSAKINESLAYEKIVDAAVMLMRSDYASLQMLFPERGTSGELRLVAFRGFTPDAARFWEWVDADSKCTCGMALRAAQRVVAPDLTACRIIADSEDHEVYVKTGIRACQTTPLIGRGGNVVGMISTHWRVPHQPSEEEFRQFDILAKQASDVIERRMSSA